MGLPAHSGTSNFKENGIMDKKELIERLKADAKAKREAEKNDTIKVSETPQALSPIEKAKALLRKTDSKYSGYISSKLLPGLEK